MHRVLIDLPHDAQVEADGDDDGIDSERHRPNAKGPTKQHQNHRDIYRNDPLPDFPAMTHRIVDQVRELVSTTTGE